MLQILPFCFQVICALRFSTNQYHNFLRGIKVMRFNVALSKLWYVAALYHHSRLVIIHSNCWRIKKLFGLKSDEEIFFINFLIKKEVVKNHSLVVEPDATLNIISNISKVYSLLYLRLLVSGGVLMKFLGDGEDDEESHNYVFILHLCWVS